MPIAGNLHDSGGKDLDPVATRLSTAESNSDSQKEGLRLVFKGGAYPLAKRKTEQRAIIELLCDPEREGTEGEWPGEFEYERATNASMGAQEGPFRLLSARDGDADEPHEPTEETQLKKTEGPALVWNGYQEENGVKVLRLTWHTKYACESYANNPDEASQHWGFFTWLVIL